MIMLKAIDNHDSNRQVVLAYADESSEFDRRMLVSDFRRNIPPEERDNFHFLQGNYELAPGDKFVYFDMGNFPYQYLVMEMGDFYISSIQEEHKLDLALLYID